MTLDRVVVLPVDALDRVVRSLGLGELHVALRPEAGWLPRDDRERAEAQAWDQLRGQGGVDEHGRVDRDVEATLALLCRPAVEFYGWIFHRGKHIGVLAAATGRDAVLAVRDGGTVTLAQANPEALPATLVDQAPVCPPGRGQPVQLDPAELRGKPPAGVRRPAVELRRARHLIGLPTTGGAELHVAVRDSAGRRVALPSPLRVADTTEGRYLNVRVGAEVLLTPGSRQELVRRLREARASLTRP
ncbi:ESX secretion-associated protein EspG [Actinokineospora bangkokensis]|uniref:ESX secretion-associated protein EspG n=1 Tax=Actinokineospora bangkokensis TaxID=1193682 RepID=A0A1Q9LCM8_9PSEU|nr:ESX secretion-associated protein EspG [Actinokineospora bangkokensis]OLR89787.1 hypothetical protein BJP25_01815 [Actinokineospora bangkokensis]